MQDVATDFRYSFAQYVGDNLTITVEKLTIHSTIMIDYSKRRTNTIYKGRYPIHDNEIAINGNAAKLMGKKVGDLVTIKGQTEEKEYLITGFQQGANFAGLNASMTYSGYLKLFPDYKLNELYIYLDKNVNTAEYLQELLDDYGDVIVASTDLDKDYEEGMGIYTDIISVVGIAMLGVSFMIIILVLYFVLNSLVIRQRRKLGIQKAVGFTTLQLMHQVAFSVMPSILVGIAAGSILGAWLVNPIMSVAQNGMGIVKAHYIIMPDWIIVFSLGVAILSYVTSLLITSKIHKISAYALVTE